MVVSAYWLPTLPRRSLMPGASISFLFSLPLKAANRLAMHAAKSAPREVELLDRREDHAADHGDERKPLAFEIVLP